LKFLCLLDDPLDHPADEQDVSVVASELNENCGPEDQIETTLVPIAWLSFGDFVCLDYRVRRTDPAIVIWYHGQTEDFEPFTIPLASSFDEFFEQLAG